MATSVILSLFRVPAARSASSLLAAAGLMAGLVAAPLGLGAGTATAGEWPAKVTADYAITVAGMSLGRFEFISEVTGRNYKLRARATASDPTGLIYTWSGQMQATGRVGARGPVPQHYRFAFRSSDKSGGVQMRMPLARASDVKLDGSLARGTPDVEVKPGHLRSVLDPMSAVVALTRAGLSGDNPCTGTLPVFDGKQRLNLKLSPKRTTTLSGGRGHGMSNKAYVCRVQYEPVSGYKDNKGTRQMAASREIEVWLVPATRANLFVPYQINIPTQIGTASITNRRISVQMRGEEQVAFVY